MKKDSSILDPSSVANKFRSEIRTEIERRALKLTLVGFLASDDEASEVYSNYTKIGCQDVGVSYEVRKVSRFDLEKEIRLVNENTDATGVIIYYPIFGGARDAHLRSILSPLKDIEGLHPYWLEKLYSNVRRVDISSFKDKSLISHRTELEAKPLLPCTPLAVFKLLEAAGELNTLSSKPLSGKQVTIFNRSEVVGRPLAFMMANDGARVYSFDISGAMEFTEEGGEKDSNISRKEALKNSDIVITGVPSASFKKISIEEISPNACCLNFSSIKNFTDDVPDNVRAFIPRVGPVTVTMCLRNVLRLAQEYQGN